MHGARCAALLALSIFSSAEQVRAAGDREHVRGPGYQGPDHRAGSMTDTEKQRAIVLGIIQRNGSPAGRAGGCICAGGNQAARAGF